MTDTYAVFARTLERGLWIDPPTEGTKQTNFVVADIDGIKIASHANITTAVSVAYGRIIREISREKRTIAQ